MAYKNIVHTSFGHGKRKQSRRGLFFFLRVLFALAIFFGIAGGAVYGIFFSPWLRMTSVRVEGTRIVSPDVLRTIAEEELSAKRWGLLPQNSYLLVPRKELQAKILETFPRLVAAEIATPSMHEVLVQVTERESIGIWCSANATTNYQLPTTNYEAISEQHLRGEGCAFFDEQGVIFDAAPSSTRGNLFWLLEDARFTTMPNIGTRVFDDSLLQFLKNVRAALSASSLNGSSYRYSIKESPEVHVRITEKTHLFSWDVYFSLEYDAAHQVRVLERVLDEELGKEKRPYVEYIDLRVKNKVFYKLR